MKKLKISTKYLKVYHGTSDINLKKIKQEGLKSPIESASWYMVSTNKDDAIYHSEKAYGNPIVIEFTVPIEDNNPKWEGWPYFWPPYKSGNGFKGNWYALKQIIPSTFIKRIYKITKEDLKRVKGSYLGKNNLDKLN